jgi:hypothetical protein
VKITREFNPADRYTYDFGLCSYEKGWAQVDTAQGFVVFWHMGPSNPPDGLQLL